MPIVLRGVGRLGVCLLAALLFAAAWPETRTRAQQEPALVRGVVLDSRTGVPIRRAAIAILRDDAAEQEHAADEGGAFTIATPSFPFTLLVSKAGFAPARIALSERPDAPRQVRMLPGAAIDGRVEDELGEPVASLIVRASRILEAGEPEDST